MLLCFHTQLSCNAHIHIHVIIWGNVYITCIQMCTPKAYTQNEANQTLQTCTLHDVFIRTLLMSTISNPLLIHPHTYIYTPHTQCTHTHTHTHTPAHTYMHMRIHTHRQTHTEGKQHNVRLLLHGGFEKSWFEQQKARGESRLVSCFISTSNALAMEHPGYHMKGWGKDKQSHDCPLSSIYSQILSYKYMYCCVSKDRPAGMIERGLSLKMVTTPRNKHVISRWREVFCRTLKVFAF